MDLLLELLLLLLLLLYVFIRELGALALEHRVKRWLASCGFDRGSRTGKLEQPNAKRKRKLRVFFLRFVGRTLSAEQGRSA